MCVPAWSRIYTGLYRCKTWFIQPACVRACVLLCVWFHLISKKQKLAVRGGSKEQKTVTKLLTGVSIAEQSIRLAQTERAGVWQLHVCVCAHSETQLDFGFIIVVAIDSVHCKSCKKQSSGIIILTVTNILPTHTQSHTLLHIHASTELRTYTHKIT